MQTIRLHVRTRVIRASPARPGCLKPFIMVRPRTKNLPILSGFISAVGPVSTDMYLPAFPAMARAFHNVAAPQYSLAAYFVGLAFGQMTQGALSDRLGRRRPLLVGLVIYTFASIGCAVAWNVGSLVV